MKINEYFYNLQLKLYWISKSGNGLKHGRMLAKNQKSDRKSIFLQFTGVEGHENWGPN